MRGLDFPIFKTKNDSSREYNLSDPEERKAYFWEKSEEDIKAVAEYLEDNTFIAYLLGKKQAGKGTYSKLLAEIFGKDKIRHLSVGDIVRETEKIRDNEEEKEKLLKYLEENYRGFLSIDDSIEAFFNRNTQTLLPTEFIMMLVKREIDKSAKSSLLIDGFPRDLDQISYSLYFRELINYRNDPDLFALFDVSEQIIDERIKYRAICPKCSTSRNLRLFPTKTQGYDKESGEFYLICDNPDCEPVRMVAKEGDEMGIEAIRDRIETDDELIRKAFSLHGVPKILLRNGMPKNIAEEMADNYELTEAANYTFDESTGNVIRTDSEWEIVDDNGIESYSLQAAAVVVSFIKQLRENLIK
jgi:adenylate kinase family enzyme